MEISSDRAPKRYDARERMIEESLYLGTVRRAFFKDQKTVYLQI